MLYKKKEAYQDDAERHEFIVFVQSAFRQTLSSADAFVSDSDSSCCAFFSKDGHTLIGYQSHQYNLGCERHHVETPNTNSSRHHYQVKTFIFSVCSVFETSYTSYCQARYRDKMKRHI